MIRELLKPSVDNEIQDVMTKLYRDERRKRLKLECNDNEVRALRKKYATVIREYKQFSRKLERAHRRIWRACDILSRDTERERKEILKKYLLDESNYK